MKRSLNVYIVFIVIVMTAAIGISQNNKLETLHLDNDNGMSNSSVNVIMQDMQGIMWMGTWDGLNRYDGHQFSQYLSNSNDTSTLSNPVIRDIQEEDSTHLWITTDGGINRFDKTTGKARRFLLDSPSLLHSRENAFRCAIDKKGHIVANYYGGKLYLYEKRHDRFVPLHMAYRPQGSTSFLAFDAYGRLWTGNSRQLACCRLKGNTLQAMKTISLPHPTVSLLHDSNGNICIQARNRLYSVSAKGDLQLIQAPFTEKMLCFYRNRREFFIGTGQGCYSIGNGKPAQLLKRCAVTSLYKGSQDILWAGTDGKGVYQLFESHRFVSSPRLANIESPIRTILKDGRTVWIGSKGNGLSCYRMVNNDSLEHMQTYNLGAGRSYNAVFSLCKGIDGKLFIGTDGNGIHFIENGRMQQMRFAHPNDVKAVYSVYTILQENDSTLFVGTSGNGLLKLSVKDGTVLHTRKFSFAQGKNSLESNIVYSLADDGRFLWIGTRGGGLSRLDKIDGHITTYRNIPQDSNSLICDDIITLLKDQKGRLWIGTTQGLTLMENSSRHPVFKRIKTNSHLDNANIHGIEEDFSHNIWVSTSNGIVRLAPDAQHTVNFYYRDGLQGNEFSDGASFADTGKNTLFFGGTNGISIISPLDMERNTFMPGLLLNHIAVDQEDAALSGGTLAVSDKAHTIEMSFSVLDYIDNDRCELSYWLEHDGFFHSRDLSWTQVEGNKKIILSKLFPGHYTLHVRQSNSAHIWSEKTLDIPIRVAFPLWARWWAVILYAVLAVLAVRYIYRIKKVHMEIRHEAEMEHRELQSREDIHQAKLRFFANVARKFTNNMTQIYADIAQLKVLEREHEYMKCVSRIDANVQQMNMQIRQLADIRKAETDDTEIVSEEIDLMESVKFAFDEFSADIDRKNIQLLIANRHNIAYLTTDKTLFAKALTNLLSYVFANAFANSSVEVLHGWNDGSWNITYTYKGTSPTDEELNMIYNRYKALEHFETKLSDGMNDPIISLTVCNDLLRRLKGQLTIEKISGNSTSCTISLPMLKLSEKKRDTSAQKDSLSQIINHKDKTILIIEKEESMTQLMNDTLQPQYNTVCINTENETQAALEANTVNLIVYDPVNNNDYTFIDLLKADEHSRNIPLIVVSTESEKENHVDMIRRGANAIIEKPFRTDYLKALADRTLTEVQRMMAFSETTAAYMQRYNSKDFSESDKKFLERAVDMLKQHYSDEDYAPDMLAKDLFVSRTQLYRKLKQLINTTPNDFIINYRMQQAERMLKNSKLTISEIITSCGFRNRAFFYKVFTRKHNCSPKEYRSS